jgi:hypothetical protein
MNQRWKPGPLNQTFEGGRHGPMRAKPNAKGVAERVQYTIRVWHAKKAKLADGNQIRLIAWEALREEITRIRLYIMPLGSNYQQRGNSGKILQTTAYRCL